MLQWMDLKAPLKDFIPVVRGSTLRKSARYIDKTKIFSVQLMISKYEYDGMHRIVFVLCVCWCGSLCVDPSPLCHRGHGSRGGCHRCDTPPAPVPVETVWYVFKCTHFVCVYVSVCASMFVRLCVSLCCAVLPHHTTHATHLNDT